MPYIIVITMHEFTSQACAALMIYNGLFQIIFFTPAIHLHSSILHIQISMTDYAFMGRGRGKIIGNSQIHWSSDRPFRIIQILHSPEHHICEAFSYGEWPFIVIQWCMTVCFIKSQWNMPYPVWNASCTALRNLCNISPIMYPKRLFIRFI